jgi:hypothetical protein
MGALRRNTRVRIKEELSKRMALELSIKERVERRQLQGEMGGYPGRCGMVQG